MVAELAAGAHGDGDRNVPWWALALGAVLGAALDADLGADLGGNATSIGAGAIIVALGLAERAGPGSRSGASPAYGLVVAPVTVLLCGP